MAKASQSKRSSTMGTSERFVDDGRAPVSDVRHRAHPLAGETWAQEKPVPGDVHVHVPADKYVARPGAQQHYAETSQTADRIHKRVSNFGPGARDTTERRVPLESIMKSASQIDYTTGHVERFKPKPGAEYRQAESSFPPQRPGLRVAGFSAKRSDHINEVFSGGPLPPGPQPRGNQRQHANNESDQVPVLRGKRMGVADDRTVMQDVLSHKGERSRNSIVGLPHFGGPHEATKESTQAPLRGKAIPMIPLDHVADVMQAQALLDRGQQTTYPNRTRQSQYASGSQTDRSGLAGGIAAYNNAKDSRTFNRTWNEPQEDIAEDWFAKFSSRGAKPRGVKRFDPSTQGGDRRVPDFNRPEQQYPAATRQSETSTDRLNRLIDDADVAQQRERRQQWRQQREEQERRASEAILEPAGAAFDQEDRYWKSVVQRQERQEQQQRRVQRATPPNPRRHLQSDGAAASMTSDRVSVELAQDDYDMWLKFQQWQQLQKQQASPPRHQQQVQQQQQQQQQALQQQDGPQSFVSREHPAVDRWSTGLRNQQRPAHVDSLQQLVNQSPTRGSTRRRGR